jgi:deoxycytidylate deaminase
MGAVLFKGGSVVNVGFNDYRYSSKFRKYYQKKGRRPTLHAEQSAILGVPLDTLSRSSLLVVRVRSNGELGLARPCESCIKMLAAVGVKRIFYSTNDGEIVELSN